MLTQEQLNNPERQKAVAKMVQNLTFLIIISVALLIAYNLTLGSLTLLAPDWTAQMKTPLEILFVLGALIVLWRIYCLAKSIDNVQKLNQKLSR